jgi:release factor glutamine methyltransferase
MKLIELEKLFVQSLSHLYDSNESRKIAHLVLESELDLKLSELSSAREKEIGNYKILLLLKILERLKTAEPIQYVLGHTWFLNFKILVNKFVLIPRPETEELVEMIINENKNFAGNILDIGTGSGCIPVALKKNIPSATIYAMDVSNDALAVAKQNATATHCAIDFIYDDILNPSFEKFSQQFDIIVSNPPYVTLNEKEAMHANVLNHEPHLALFTTADALQFYKAILSFAQQKLAASGKIYLEVNDVYADDVAGLFSTIFNNVITKKDMIGNKRFVYCNS